MKRQITCVLLAIALLSGCTNIQRGTLVGALIGGGIGAGIGAAGVVPSPRRRTISVNRRRSKDKWRPINNLGTVPIFVQRKWDCPLPEY